VAVTAAASATSADLAATAEGGYLTGGGGAANVAPGTLVSIIGTGLSANTVGADLSANQLPSQLGGTEVYFNGIMSPLVYVSPTQINAQIPWDWATPPASALTSVP